jgi:hypothetical protein
MNASTRSSLVLAALAAAFSMVPAVAAQQTVDPTGRYSFKSIANGDSLHGVIVVRRTDGKLAATLSSNQTPTFEAKTVTLTGRTLKILADVNETQLTVTLEFDGERVSGRWDNAEGAGAVATVKREPAPPRQGQPPQR